MTWDKGQYFLERKKVRFPSGLPDSRSIGFFAPGKLKRIDLEGNLVQVLADVKGSPRGAAWSSSGIILYPPAGTFSDLYQIPASGGTPQKGNGTDRKPKGIEPSLACVSPRRKALSLFSWMDEEQPDVQVLYVGSLDTKQEHPPCGQNQLGDPPTSAVEEPSILRARWSNGDATFQRTIISEAVSGDPVALPDPCCG